MATGRGTRSGKARTREEARARAAALRVAAAKEQRRRRVLLASTAVLVVLALVVVLVVVKLTSDSGGTTTAVSGAAPASVVSKVTGVPASTLDEVGVGSVQAAPQQIKAPALTADGKPKILYVGAEYCPFCAAERWPVVVALSRFGTWQGLGATASAHNDVFPDTQTLSFHGATYTSDVLAFTGVETRSNQVQGNQYKPLDTLSAEDQKTFDTWDKPPYAQNEGGIPFIDIGGKYVSSGASYSPDVLKGLTRAQIAAALDDPNDKVAQAVVGAANVLTAAICRITDNKPSDVCTSAGVRTAMQRLDAAQ
jgi:hypothetical protein